MTLGIRARLFWTSVGLLLVVGGVSGVWLERSLKASLTQQVEAELSHQAGALREVAEIVPPLGGAPSEAELARRLGAAAHLRVTFIDGAGRVIGDSDVPPAALARVENHKDRPEVAAALAGQEGRATRFSHTVDAELTYLALPYTRADGSRAVVRVAKQTSSIAASMAQLRARLLWAGALGLALAVLMSWLASQWFSQAVLELLQNVRAFAEGPRTGRRDRPVAVTRRVVREDELGSLARSINDMAREMEDALATLARERDRFMSILDGMSEAVLTLDEETRVTLINPAAMQLLAVRSTPVGRSLVEVVRSPALAEVAGRALGGEEAELELTLPGPRAAHVLARATPLRGGPGAVVVLHDVTEIRRLERVRRDFVANVSHELRTPVSIIQVNAETLLDGAMDEPEQARVFLEALLRNAERLSRLIADLLDISRFEAGSQRLHLEDVSVAEVAQRTISALERAAHEQSIELKLEVPPDVRVFADDRALDQILYNLIENAVKYMQEGGRVTLRARSAGDRTEIEVQDNGPGIAPQHRPRLFERFYRVDPGRSREMGGTGLGLAIVKHLAVAMGGQVGMRAASPRGSVFWVHLPTRPAPPAPDPRPTEAG